MKKRNNNNESFEPALLNNKKKIYSHVIAQLLQTGAPYLLDCFRLCRVITSRGHCQRRRTAIDQDMPSWGMSNEILSLFDHVCTAEIEYSGQLPKPHRWYHSVRE